MEILINNEQVVCSNELVIKEEMLNTSSTILKNCYPLSWESTKDYTNYYYPEDYSKCVIYDNENLLFCGVAKRTGNINLNPREFHGCDIQILDFKTFLSEGETLDFVISNKTVLEAIQMVINAIGGYGIILGNVDINGSNDIIGAYSTANKTAYDVFNYLAEITQSRWTTRLVDDTTIAVDFYNPETMPSGTTLQYNQTFFENNNIKNINYSYSTQDYRNKQVMTSNEVQADINTTEQIVTDGYAKVYQLENNIFEVLSAMNGSNYLTIATKEEKELGIEADLYYEAGKNTIEFENLYSAGTSLSITYNALVKGRQVIYNNDEVDRISTNTGRKGVIARYENRNDALSSQELLAIGNSYIKYKGSAEIKLTVETRNNNLWNVGECVSATEFPLQPLNTDYMVKSRETHIYTAAKEIFYTYVLSSSFNSENEINYFDNQRAKASGNITAGNFIDRNIDIENTANIIFDNLVKEEISLGDNILNAKLNAPLVQ
jgi:hypothetical protein